MMLVMLLLLQSCLFCFPVDEALHAFAQQQAPSGATLLQQSGTQLDLNEGNHEPVYPPSARKGL
jgi:hypothetical protein